MKIAFLNMYNGLVDRGAETFVKEVAQKLAIRHEVVVFQSGGPSGKENYKVEKIPMKIDWARKSGAGSFLSLLFLDYWNRLVFRFSLKTLSKIVKEKFDIVVPVNGGWMPALMRLATWVYRGKMVISGQAGMGWDERNNLWCFPDTFVALSSKAKLWAKKVNPLIRTVYVPNGVDTERFTANGPTFKTNLPKPIILCVGALTKSKRIDLTIKAVANLGNASLLVVGDGDLRRELSWLGKRLLGKRFQLVKIPFSEMPQIYRAVDVFTLASEPFHSFEIVLVEAMASSLPVVANKDDIRREIVGRAGVLVDPTNTETYAIALENAMRLRWGKRPQNQARKFSWDIIASQYQKLFRKITK
ncbi:MAG: Glycosyl transferase group 1 [Candidatus Woesebacteria bacterium GW2011_GWC2_45_9]|uniref:Glycosyl transferase group 1 n=1 Tax=Candidatus Woesebacteria bacterium GW2011_GWC2_45_9 TaxID=1618589 RepID=A0A0G1QJ45_9BACT|nr:MAG: Glycosyl transferase group 1 [Candidatus Woesebacteria bacterium GW2011_GWC2_45_9]